ncbi:glycosyltransferase [Streptomyces albus]|nr:glycosyltransferase [Streptomyces albus]
MTTDPHPADAPDLSVVVPADAGPEALKASAASVLEQTLRHTEAVLVDPGRDSATTRACAALAARHAGRVRHVTAARGADLRDTGADHARGTWVTFLGPGERLQKDAGRNLLAAALDTGADLVAGTWTRLPAPGEKLPRGAEQAEPAWQRPLHTRTRTVGSLTDAPGLVVHDSLVTGFCVRRSLLGPDARPGVRHEEAPPSATSSSASAPPSPPGPSPSSPTRSPPTAPPPTRPPTPPPASPPPPAPPGCSPGTATRGWPRPANAPSSPTTSCPAPPPCSAWAARSAPAPPPRSRRCSPGT